MKLFLDDENDGFGTCDICGSPLDPDDRFIHLCKYCQGMQDEEF